ncbi:MAG: aldo/keto reductase [Planctomycetota bacterium]
MPTPTPASASASAHSHGATALDHYVTLGRTGLRVSPLCLGTMTFGKEWGWGSTPEDSVKITDAYLDRGGNFIDTANIYTKGHSEHILGEHLSNNPAKRDRLVIATKCTGNMFEGDPNGGGGGRLALMNAVEESLRRLKTDRIDLLWAHFHDKHTPIEETLRTFDDLVRQGKVRYLGLSDHPAWLCAHAQGLCTLRGWEPLAAIQIEYSLIERSVEGELLPMAEELGLGVTPWSPLKGGILTGKYTRDKIDQAEGRGASWTRDIDDRGFTIIDALVEVAESVGCTPAQAALKWVQDRSAVTSTIIGARTMDQLTANLGALAVELTPEHTEKLEKASHQRLAFPHDFLRTIPTVIQGGTSINGHACEPWPMAPQVADKSF